MARDVGVESTRDWLVYLGCDFMHIWRTIFGLKVD